MGYKFYHILYIYKIKGSLSLQLKLENANKHQHFLKTNSYCIVWVHLPDRK